MTVAKDASDGKGSKGRRGRKRGSGGSGGTGAEEATPPGALRPLDHGAAEEPKKSTNKVPISIERKFSSYLALVQIYFLHSAIYTHVDIMSDFECFYKTS